MSYVITKKIKLFVLLFSLTLVSCSSVFYHPTSKIYHHPEDYGYKYENLKINSSSGVVLSAWHFPADKPKATIIHLHGNAENISAHFTQLVWLVKEGYSLLEFDYRGYGKSTGKPSHEGLIEDFVHVYDYVMENPEFKNAGKIILYGQSIGGNIMINGLHRLRSPDRISLVVIEGSFLNYTKLVRDKINELKPLNLIEPLISESLTKNYRPLDLDSIKMPSPLLVIHSREDDVVPFSNGETIAIMFNPEQFWKTKGGHLAFNFSKQNKKKLLQYLSKFD